MNIILTGATGYLGTKLLHHLLEMDNKVLCICIPGTTDNIQNHFRNSKNLFILYINNPNYEKVMMEFKTETVIHIAGVYQNNENSELKVIEGNILFPIKLIDIVNKSGIKRWINTCTSLPENLNSYTISKYQFSQWGKYYSEKYGFDFININLEHFYGPNGNNNNFITFICNKLIKNEPIDLTTGKQRRDFIHVEDVCKAYLLLLDTPPIGYIDVPVGSGDAPTIREVVEYLHEISNSKSIINYGAIPLRKNEPMLCLADLTIISKFGFTVDFDWKKGMKSIITVKNNSN